MRHECALDGYAYRLRPICDHDAAFVVELRSNPDLNQYLHTGADCLDDQLEWLQRYYRRSNDFYFVIEKIISGRPEGVVGLYDIDKESSCGEWGRWVVKPGSLCAVESAWLTYRIAFEQLNLQSVYCRTVASNQKVVSFHDSCGITNRKELPNHFLIEGRSFDAIEHRLGIGEWRIISPAMENLVRLTARRIVCE